MGGKPPLIRNKDKYLKDNFISFLYKLELKEMVVEPQLYINATNNSFALQSESYTQINVDDDGNAILSDKSIDKVARRVIEIMKKEGLI